MSTALWSGWRGCECQRHRPRWGTSGKLLSLSVQRQVFIQKQAIGYVNNMGLFCLTLSVFINLLLSHRVVSEGPLTEIVMPPTSLRRG